MDRQLAAFARQELEEDYGLTRVVDTGDDFFNALIYGTLKSLVERVDSSGFCQTSYGEMNGVKCYGHTHYPRDSAEAARVLAKWGFGDRAARILEFSLRNKPAGQYYLPHLYRPDGTIKANTVQVDTPAHLVIALAACVEMTGDSDRLYAVFQQLDTILDGTWQHHFHPECNLLDGGNYNEQVSGHGAICDLFANSSSFRALELMGEMAPRWGRDDLVDKYRTRQALVAAGIETHLYEPERGVYLVKRDYPSGTPSLAVNWVSLYCHRWYPGRPEAWEAVFGQLQRETTLDWAGHRVISGSLSRHCVLGKFFGYLLAYLKQTGREELLRQHLAFAKQTIVKPRNLFPEWWYFKKPAVMSEYWVGFWKKYAGVWCDYQSDPQGDYTVDSGNCEQSAVFLLHLVEDVLANGQERLD